MALGFDMKDPVVNPATFAERVTDWIAFFKSWNQKLGFVGRYFGKTDYNWKFNEVPGNLKTLVPGNFDNLRYVCPLTSTGPLAEQRFVDINGNVGGVNAIYPIAFEEQGELSDGTKLSDAQARKCGRNAARRTCEAIAKQIEKVDPFSPPIDLQISESGKVFVFLDVEPQTKLDANFWRGWAETVAVYTINLGTSMQPKLVQPLLPCLYCAVEDNGPRLAAVRSIFDNARAPRCWALATGWNPHGLVFKSDATGLAGIAGLEATEADAQANLPNFGPLHQRSLPEAPVVVWQYFLNFNFKKGFDIDFAVTPSLQFSGRPITDFMLRINWQ